MQIDFNLRFPYCSTDVRQSIRETESLNASDARNSEDEN